MESNLTLVCQKLVYKYLPRLALGLGVYYCLITIAHANLVPAHAAPVMVGLAGASAAVLFGIYAWLKLIPPPVFWAHPIELVMAEIVLLNSLGHLYFLADLKQTTNVTLAIIGGGLLFLSARWLAVFIVTCVAGWALVTWTTFRGEAWIHYAFMLFTATTISVLAHFVRMTGIRQVEGTRMVIQEMNLRKQAEDQQRRLEGELQQAEKLRSLGVLAGGVAHDFNNLLVGVLGNTELARAEFDPESRVQPFLAEISAAARCAADLTRQMLDYSGKGRFVVEPIQLGDITGEMSRLLRASIPRNVRLEHNFPEDLPAIEADAAQLRQIIMNLAINGAEAIGERQGVITLSSGVEEVDGSQPGTEHWYGAKSKGEYVCLRVADSGPGMDEETRARIFEPFFSTKTSGRGLGLAAVLGIMRGHRRGIQVETSRQTGTTFTVWFPRSTHRPVHLREPAVEARPMQGEGTVLVADDEPAVRTLIRRILERGGFSVVVAEDGAQALEVFDTRRDQIVLAVLDLTMPKMGGHETVVKLRATRSSLPTILTSGYDQEDIAKRLELESAIFLHKPFTPTELRAAVDRALGGCDSSAAATS